MITTYLLGTWCPLGPARFELVWVHEREHGLAGHAEHHDDELGHGVEGVVRVLIMDTIAARFPERPSRRYHTFRLALELEQHLPADDIAEGRSGVPVRRGSCAAGRKGDVNGHELRRRWNRRSVMAGDDSDDRACRRVAAAVEGCVVVHGRAPIVSTAVGSALLPVRYDQSRSSSVTDFRKLTARCRDAASERPDHRYVENSCSEE
jgi:hypothetical protein